MSKIADVLLFKEGYYYLTYRIVAPNADGEDRGGYAEIYEWNFKDFGIDRNGFEFPGDAYAYLVSLSPLREPRKNGVHLDMQDGIIPSGECIVITGDNKLPEYNDKEEERLKKMGEV